LGRRNLNRLRHLCPRSDTLWDSGEAQLFVFDPRRMQRRLTPSLPTRLCSAMSPISLGGPAPVFQTQAKVARSLAVSETSTDGVVDPWWSYARLIRSD